MKRITMKIDGMMCGMCEAHVCDAIRKAVPSARKVSACLRRDPESGPFRQESQSLQTQKRSFVPDR